MRLKPRPNSARTRPVPFDKSSDDHAHGSCKCGDCWCTEERGLSIAVSGTVGTAHIPSIGHWVGPAARDTDAGGSRRALQSRAYTDCSFPRADRTDESKAPFHSADTWQADLPVRRDPTPFIFGRASCVAAPPKGGSISRAATDNPMYRRPPAALCAWDGSAGGVSAFRRFVTRLPLSFGRADRFSSCSDTASGAAAPKTRCTCGPAGRPPTFSVTKRKGLPHKAAEDAIRVGC
ncbi:hypothetical protein DIPPA_17623 [Diplonema papillatum]|nr:hypothetical protein DIPPA_17623 [Diplonema papillatum]